MAERTLRLRVQTPQSVVLDTAVDSLRVPTETGQVGLRPRAEPAALGVEPGLVLASHPGGRHFVATAGGLLRCGGGSATLVTPLAVVAGSAEEVRSALDSELRKVSADLELRRLLQRLETGLLHELRRGARAEKR